MMKKTTKIKTKTKNTTSIFDKRPIEVKKYDRMQEMKYIAGRPLSESNINNLVEAIYDWAELPTSRNFDEFLDDRCIFDEQMFDWCKAHPEINEAVRHAKRHVGIIRENGMADHKFDTKTYGIVQHHFSSTWRATRDEDYQRKVALTQTAASVPTVIKVIQEATPNCPEVPDYRKASTLDVTNYETEVVSALKGKEDEELY